MASDYNKIRKENVEDYGKKIPVFGPMLLSERYDSQIHFIFELLQNAEDALKRRGNKAGSRSVKFSLFKDHLRVSHFGQAFTEQDVRGICGIGESTKAVDLNSIGRFGIGFKAVYSVTGSPEIHSGDEHFAIDSYVWPRSISPLLVSSNETVFILPFKSGDTNAYKVILEGLMNLGARTLLFLREIDHIEWNASGGESGAYIRESKDSLSGNARELLVLGKQAGEVDIEERWIILSRPVSNQGKHAGHVEVAFQIAEDPKSKIDVIVPLVDANLVVFFPTIVPLNLGFLIQGPYRTTPSRDNVPPHDAWNEYLVQETASLLAESLETLKSHGLLTTELLETLPIDGTRFASGARFFPLYDKVRDVLRRQAFLPTANNGHVSASEAIIGRGQDLRELFTSEQMMDLLGNQRLAHWLHPSITQERTPQLYLYLQKDLGIQEIVPQTIATRITGKFLEKQPDEWIARFYLFLDGQSAIVRNLKNKPIFRVENGAMEFGWDGYKPRVFLPSRSKTDFLTVKRVIYSYKNVSEFLRKLELREADLVDDAILNVLPRYKSEGLKVSFQEYASDMERILNAFDTNFKDQQAALVAELKESFFLSVIDAGTKAERFSLPGDVYLATEKILGLFNGVEGVSIINDQKYPFWRGERSRNLLEAVGVSRRLAVIPVEHLLSMDEKIKKIKENAGEWGVWTDWDILGLDNFLMCLEKLTHEQRLDKVVLFWDLLSDLAAYRGSAVFSGTCTWSFHRRTSSFKFDARFVNNLNNKKWVVGSDGNTYSPAEICFDSLEPAWPKNDVLLAAIKFKPSLINELERQVGLEPGIVSLLIQRGISLEDLKKALGIVDKAPSVVVDNQKESPLKTSSNEDPVIQVAPISFIKSSSSPIEGSGLLEHGDGQNAEESRPSNKERSSGEDFDGENEDAGLASSSGKRRSASESSARTDNGREFVSYVAVHGFDNEADGRVSHEENMEIEDKAIVAILKEETRLLRAPINNKGYDLYQAGSNGTAVKFVEVKGISGSYKSRPATLSKAQFEMALKHGDMYWLYVVENIQAPQDMRIIRIQDPAGKAKSFTFDSGWVSFAEKIEEGQQIATTNATKGAVKERVTLLLKESSDALTAHELAEKLGVDKMQVNKLLYGDLKDLVVHEPDNRWRIKEGQ